MARVTLEGLGKHFGADKIIDHVDLEIKEGEFLTLLGPSGCGKTTTLRIVAGFLSPNVGRVLFDGKDVTRVPTQSRKLGMVFQDYALFPHLTVAENVGFALKSHGMRKADADKRVNELLALIRLPAVANRYPLELSGGQQQRVAIARALAHTPAVLLMDEPLGALDLKLREAMQNELHSIQRQLGITTIYVTHDQEEALSLSHRIALMRFGRIEQLDTPKEIYSRPKTPFAAFFLGKVNFLQGHVVGRVGSNYEIKVGRETLLCPIDGQHQSFDLDAHVVLGVRPEQLRLNQAQQAGGQNVLHGRIAREKFIGKVVQFDVEVDSGATIVVDGSLEQAKGVGSHVQLVWDARMTHLYPFAEDPELGITRAEDKRRAIGAPAAIDARGDLETNRMAPA
ncbi:ABC transporter ATP-binding protein [Variovorax sp. PBL-E5]|uniref:ABC transporter ATP-binding protein n=1 Tax=Variovorax sp. PBL-E5 TaxID=434014 RepID=UPI0013198AA5|nr:ABC transporter ATP-binding protein [Variovorax sp. PBL-E5]VTU45343.1 Spermidine/putrescine import ATP-binding protein PotA [Variovorax sp. PBL-E5]